MLAVGPLFWIPIANRFGRRPVWITSVLIAGLFNVGCALSNNYGTHLAMRILSAFFMSPGIALGQGVVVETFSTRQRAQKMV
jgi:MFS family permease